MTSSRRSPWRRTLAVLSAFLLLFAPLACNTTEGVGEDIESAGEAIDEAAEDAHD